MARAPILPTNWKDPNGANPAVTSAIVKFHKIISKIPQIYIDVVNTFNARPAVNARYAYDLDMSLFNYLLAAAGRQVEALLFEGGGQDDLWLSVDYVVPAYKKGTAQEFANIYRQSPIYRAARPTLQDVLADDGYRLRVALLRSRQFEEMQALSSDIKTDMARTLSTGVASGLPPREVAEQLKALIPTEEKRAEKIARTEIGTALRRARWDESEDAQERYGLKMLEMHLSALSPTTRESHAARHGELYTVEQAREFASKDANSINCKCSSTSVIVDNDGKPLVPNVQERARQIFRNWSRENA